MRKLDSYRKIEHEGKVGYMISHTMGNSASESTINYPHTTPEYMIYYFLKGGGNIKIEGHYYEIGEGDIVFVCPAEVFCCSVDNDTFHERIVLHVNETMLKNFNLECSSMFVPFYKKQKGMGNKICATDVQKYGLDKLLKEIFALSGEENEMNSLLCICKAVEAVEKVRETISPFGTDDSYKPRTNPLISEVLKYLNEHFKEVTGISQVAKEFNIDKSYLSHLFKECVGISLWNYVIFRRIYFFNSQIRENDSVEETCYRAGFQNYSNFYRLYKKHMKKTPIQFKKEIKNEKGV